MRMVNEKTSVAKIQTSYVEERAQADLSRARRKTLVMRRISIFFVLVAIFSFFMISSLLRQSATLEEMKEEKKQLDIELASMKKKEVILQEEIVKLNDEEYIAKLARKDYFLSGNNEIIFNLPEEKQEKEKSSE